MSARKLSTVATVLAALMIPSAMQAAEFEWRPVGASGSHDPPAGNSIVLHGGGQTVTLETWMSDWDPTHGSGQPLATYQFRLDSTGYSSGSGLPLAPPNGCCPGSSADAFIDSLHPDFVFANLPPPCFGIPATNLITPDYEFGATILGGCFVVDDGSAYYGGTLILEAPVGAIGTYTIGYDPSDTKTFMRDQFGVPITPLNLTPVQITVLCLDNAECDDGDACTDDICEPNGTCSHEPNYNETLFCCNPQTGGLITIDDDNDCTEDNCNPDGSVEHPPVPEGSFCGGPPVGACDAQDTCDAFGTCIENFAPALTPCGNQSDTDCTDPDTCNGSGACLPNHAPGGTPCGDPSDTDCTNPDSCNGSGSCLANHAANGTICDDDLFCTVDEFCTNGACGNGASTCDDGVGCTDDSCDEGNDLCFNDPNDANCDNGLWCDGFESCDLVDDCQPGIPPDCNDGVGCTDDSCNEGADACANDPNDANCDNGLWCDGFETCDPDFDCQDGVAPDCNDDIDCTLDSCNEFADVCAHAPDHELCPEDGLFCNGEEICVVGVGCDHSGSPCNGPCDEVLGCLCDPPAVEIAGPRYLAITLQPPTSGPQAIVLQPACATGIPRYVGAPMPFRPDWPLPSTAKVGLLVDDPADAAFLTPAEWGDPIYVTGAALSPETLFHVYADCGFPGEPGFSDVTTVQTPLMADVDRNFVVNFADIQFTVLAFEGNLPIIAATMADVDTSRCEPDQFVNFHDIQRAILTFERLTDPLGDCPFDCPRCHPALCDDGNMCTDDGCDIETGSCWNVPNYNPATECCNPQTGGTEPIGDGDLCTIDDCNEATGQVSHTPMDCDDGDDCTLDECVAGNCVNTSFEDIPCEDNGDCPPTSSFCDGEFCTCPGLPAMVYELQPVGSSGAFQIIDRQIIIPPGGATVTVRHYLSDWDRNHDNNPRLGAYQASISLESLTSGTSGSLSLAEIPCQTSQDCYEPGHSPPTPVCEVDDTCNLYAALYIQQNDPDWVYFGISAIAAAAPYHDDYLPWAATPWTGGTGASDTGVKKYGGTIILDVSPDASGTFTLEFDPAVIATFANDAAGAMITPLTLRPAYITISD